MVTLVIPTDLVLNGETDVVNFLHRAASMLMAERLPVYMLGPVDTEKELETYNFRKYVQYREIIEFIEDSEIADVEIKVWKQ